MDSSRSKELGAGESWRSLECCLMGMREALCAASNTVLKEGAA